MKSRTHILLLSFLLVSLSPVTGAMGQATATTQPPPAEVMPKDPTELMMLAVKRNRLTSPELKPWHVKATYQTYDADGKPKDPGTFEMWWAAPDKYKMALTSPSFTQTQYRTAAGTYFVGEQKWPPYPEVLIQHELVSPLPDYQNIPSPKFDAKDIKLGDATLKCLRFVSQQESLQFAGPQYCFADDIPAIRLKSSLDEATLFNKMLLIQGQYAAQLIHVTKKKLPLLHIEVTALDLLTEAAGPDLAPPKDAVHAPTRTAAVSAGVIAGRRIGGTAPEYPGYARAAWIQGTVVLSATILEDGTMGELSVISGPGELRKSALAAAQTWRYTPYVLNGEAVKVRTQINVIYTLGVR